jgi:hypothetical protein
MLGHDRSVPAPSGDDGLRPYRPIDVVTAYRVSRETFRVASRSTLPKLGEPFGIMRAFTKRFPFGQYSQTIAETATQVRSFFATTDEIQEINIRASQNAIKVMAGSPEKWRPRAPTCTISGCSISSVASVASCRPRPTGTRRSTICATSRSCWSGASILADGGRGDR